MAHCVFTMTSPHTDTNFSSGPSNLAVCLGIKVTSAIHLVSTKLK